MSEPERQATAARRGLTVRTKAGIALVLLALFVPLVTNEYSQYVVNLALVYVLVTVGFNIAIGTLGQLAFCNVALFGIGAYTTGILMYHFQWPFWVALIPSGIAGAAAGFLASFAFSTTIAIAEARPGPVPASPSTTASLVIESRIPTSSAGVKDAS